MSSKIKLAFTGWILIGSMLSVIFVCHTFAQEVEWTPMGPEGGFLLSFAIAPSSPNVLYGGCDIYGGLYKSTDQGEHWAFMGLISELGSVQDVKVHPESCDVVYAACEDGGVYKTIDGGLHWNRILKRDATAYSIGIDPNSPNVVYAGFVINIADQYGLYKSMDDGITWSDSSFQGNSVVDICFDPDSINSVYAGSSYGVHRSKDGGETWTFLGPPNPSATIFTLVVVDFNTLYAGSHTDERDMGKVYKTTDGGKTWNVSYDLGTTVYCLDVDPKNANILYMAACSNRATFGREGVYKTTDGGENWFPVNNGLTDRMVWAIKVDPVSPHIVYAVTDGLGGVYKSLDKAKRWTPITSGLQQTLIEAMCFDASHTLFAAVGWGTYRDIPCIFKSQDNGLSWDTLSTIPSPYYMTSIWDMVAHPEIDDLIYVGGLSHYSDTVEDPTCGLLYRSHDGGETWEPLWTAEDEWILSLEIDPVTKHIYAGTGGGDTAQFYKILKSTDGGDHWVETSGWDYPGNSILDIVVDPSSPNILYAGTGGAIFKSTDYGENWIPQAILPLAHTLLIDPNSPNIIYAGIGGTVMDSGGVYQSTDFGVNWEPIGLEDYPITSLVGSFNSPDILYAGTGGMFLETTGRGVFRSTDKGISWLPINVNLTSPFILSMLVDPICHSTIYAGSMGRGIFKATDKTGVRMAEIDHTENVTWALSNFPNPFNATTNITYHVSLIGHVTLKIFDVSGRLVRLLIDEPKQPGTYSVIWEGRDDTGNVVASGLYFSTLQGGQYHVVKKMMLLQ